MKHCKQRIWRSTYPNVHVESPPPSSPALSYRKPAPAGPSREIRAAQSSDKRYALYIPCSGSRTIDVPYILRIGLRTTHLFLQSKTISSPSAKHTTVLKPTVSLKATTCLREECHSLPWAEKPEDEVQYKQTPCVHMRHHFGAERIKILIRLHK